MIYLSKILSMSKTNTIILSIFVITVLCKFNFYGQAIADSSTALWSDIKSFNGVTDFKKSGRVLLTNAYAWGAFSKDGKRTYRTINPKATIDVLFVPFDIDKNSFSRHDLILEIFYRDDIEAKSKKNKSILDNRVIIKSRIDFVKENEYADVGYIQCKGDGKWKVCQIFLEKTPRQLARAINGSFNFKIEMPSSGRIGLPVSYMCLNYVEHKVFVERREKNRLERGFRRIDHQPLKAQVELEEKWKNLGFVVWPTNYLELVFPNSNISNSLAGKELTCLEIPGQAEPVSFVIHAIKDLVDVKVKLSQLSCEKSSVLPDMVDIYKVIFNDQRLGWDPWGRSTVYGKCPDYLVKSSTIEKIDAGSNQQFWLTINVPEDSRAGLYTGRVMLYVEDKLVYELPISLEVMGIKLAENKVKHMVYHSPYFRQYHKKPELVLRDMKEHGIVPIFYPHLLYRKSMLPKTSSGDVYIRLNDFEHELQVFKQINPEAKIVFIGTIPPSSVWRRLKGPEPIFQKPFKQFDETYGRILRDYASLGRKYGLDIIFHFNDEPSNNLQKRRETFLCCKIARMNGLKTWSTYYIEVDKQLKLTPAEIVEGVNYLQPLSGYLDVFVYPIWHVNANTPRIVEATNSEMAYYTTYPGTSIRPIYNRFLHGIHAHATNCRYVVSYAYRDSLADPFDDMDCRPICENTIGQNDYLLTYPSWNDDILPTIAYEALREGIEDSRLISTMQSLAEEALISGDSNAEKIGSEAISYLECMLKAVVPNGFKYDFWHKHKVLPEDPMEKAILGKLNNGESLDYGVFDEIRKDICNKIILLQEVLGKKYEANTSKSENR